MAQSNCVQWEHMAALDVQPICFVCVMDNMGHTLAL